MTITSSLGPDGYTVSIRSPGSLVGRPRIGLFGDSITAYMHIHAGTATSLVNNGDGTATITYGSSVSLQPGDMVGCAFASDRGYIIDETPLLSVTGTGPYQYRFALKGTPTVTPDPGGSAALVYRQRRGANGYGAWAQFFIKQNAEYVNLGAAGDTFEMMEARFDRDVKPIASTLNRICVCAGVNGIFSGAQSFATVKASAISLLSKVAALGLPIDIIMQPPQGSSRAGWTTASFGVYKQFRAWQAQYAKSNGWGWIDTWDAASGSANLLNVSDTNCNPTTGALADQIHPSNYGGVLIGKKVASFHSKFIPSGTRLVASNSDGNLLPNGLMTDGGAGTAANWTIGVLSGAPVTTASIVARTIANDGDIIGNNQRLSVAFAANNDQIRFYSPNLGPQLTHGDKFRVSAHIKVVSGFQYIKGIELYVLSQTVTTGNLFFYDLAYLSTYASGLPDLIDGVSEVECYVRSPVEIHGAVQNIVCYVIITGAGAGTGVVDIGRFTAVKAL